jgi:hypothetical protein
VPPGGLETRWDQPTGIFYECIAAPATKPLQGLNEVPIKTTVLHLLNQNRRDLPVILFSAAYMAVFVAVALTRHNYEFILYAAVVLLLASWILVKQRTVQFDLVILWGLSLWGLLHMAGGNIHVSGNVLYNVQLIPRFLRYDQLVHAFGFGTATLVCFHILSGMLDPAAPRRLTLIILVALMGCGLGALNEIVEFLAVTLMPETNVGGYENTLWDLIFNLIGASLAATWAMNTNRNVSARAVPQN